MNYPHFEWKFNPTHLNQPAEFYFRFMLSGEGQTSFREACLLACDRINSLRENQPVALCYSGGIRSEALALCLQQKNIPFRPYFLDLWGINGKIFWQQKKKFEEKFQLEVQVIRVEREEFYAQARELFRNFQISAPTYIAMAQLFDKIPKNEFIVTGDGDLSAKGKYIQQIAAHLPLNEGKKINRTLLFRPANVFFYQWQNKFKRKGEFSFYRSTPELIQSQIRDSKFICQYPISDTFKIFQEHFSELEFREKSTNWSHESYKENVWVREWLEQCAREFDWKNWREDLGILVSI